MIKREFCSVQSEKSWFFEVVTISRTENWKSRLSISWYSISQYDERTSWNRGSRRWSDNKRRWDHCRNRKTAGMYDMDNIKTMWIHRLKTSTPILWWQPPGLLIMRQKFIFVLENVGNDKTFTPKTLERAQLGDYKVKNYKRNTINLEEHTHRFWEDWFEKDYNAPGNPVAAHSQTLKCTL